MLYAIICYNSEAAISAWTPEEDAAVMTRHQAVMAGLAAKGKLGPVARLQPTSAATTVRSGREKAVFDGPFAETKEQMLGFYVVDCETRAEAIEIAKQFVEAPGCMEIRPLLGYWPAPGGLGGST